MLNAKKKKPRQRNRARNKAHRVADTPDNHVNREGSETEENDMPELVTTEAEDPTESVPLQEPIKETLKPVETKNSLESNKSNQLASSSLFENNETLKMIQKMMRAKLLRKASSEEGSDHLPSNDENKDNKCRKEVIALKAKKCESEGSENVKSEKRKEEPQKKEQVGENLVEESSFIANLQKKMESAIADGGADLPNALLDNLQKLFNQDPISDVESSDDEDEYIEYIYKPRQYFLVSLCNYCKLDLTTATENGTGIACKRCRMTYYCRAEHMQSDTAHRQLCYALQQVADQCDGHIFRKCGAFTTEQFRSYRIVTIRNVESVMNRPLTATEQEVILFPRICADIHCRAYKFAGLEDCKKCGQVAFCKDKPEHLPKSHQFWCKAYQLFKKLIIQQEKLGRLEPTLPNRILRDLPGSCCNTKQILTKLNCDIRDPCEYATLTQVSTCPLTAWYSLKLCGQLKKSDVMTIHLIGAEIEFEVDILHKWELFFLHITPSLKQLNVVFVGPELNPGNISFDQLKKTKCCRSCRKTHRNVSYHFQSQLYHDYCTLKTFLKPDLICFFNAGLYRTNGFQMSDTWPDTILAAANLNCPAVVTAYTEYETPLDMGRFMQEANRRVNVVLPPTLNPFASEKPERNFISDDVAPLMFKNFWCFVVE